MALDDAREIMTKCTVINVLCFVLGFLVTVVESAAPVFDGLPTEVYVGEAETGSRLLYIYSIQDPNGDSFTLAETITAEKDGVAVAGTYDEFEIKLNTLTGNYELWTTGASAFDYATVDKFFVTTTATDTNGETSLSLDVEVNVVETEQVTINNVEGTANNLVINALNTGQSVAVKTVDSTSALGSDIEYSLVSDPSFTPEFFVIDPSSGVIRTNRELKYLNASNPTLTLSVNAYDRTNHIQVYSKQTVLLTNQNYVPSTTNMINGLAESKLENLAAGTILFTISTEDPDSQTHTYRYTCTPTALEDTFELDANGNFMIATGKSLDYETHPSISCDFYIHDGIDEGGPFVYDLTVENANEAPSFSNSMYHVSTSEGSKGSITFDPTLDCTDPDTGDSISYSFNPANNSDRFNVDSNGLFTFNTDYDVDNNAMPTSVVVTVYCVDSGHIDGQSLTGTAQVTITISDANDNTPTFPFNSYTFVVSDTTEPGSVIGTITPTDDDSTSNGDVRCSASSGSAYSSYYAIGYNCNVYLTKQVDFAAGTQTRFVALATDDGTPQLTGTSTVDIIYQQSPTTTTTTAATTTPYNFFDHGGNIALFVFALLMGLALLGLLTWCLINMCCGNACGGACRNMGDCRCFERRERRYPARQRQRPETPETPPPKYRRPQEAEPEHRQYPTIDRQNGMRPSRPPSYPMTRTAPSFSPGYY